MKIPIITLCLITTIAFAQMPPQIPPHPARPFNPNDAIEKADTLPENYILKLTVTDKDQQITELSLVVATAQFKADASDAKMTFSGTLVPEEDGSILVRYNLGSQVAVPMGNNSIQYNTSAVQASVRLQIGKPIDILKSGTRIYQLTVSRLADKPKKDK